MPVSGSTCRLMTSQPSTWLLSGLGYFLRKAYETSSHEWVYVWCVAKNLTIFSLTFVLHWDWASTDDFGFLRVVVFLLSFTVLNWHNKGKFDRPEFFLLDVLLKPYAAITSTLPERKLPHHTLQKNHPHPHTMHPNTHTQNRERENDGSTFWRFSFSKSACREKAQRTHTRAEKWSPPSCSKLDTSLFVYNQKTLLITYLRNFHEDQAKSDKRWAERHCSYQIRGHFKRYGDLIVRSL